jgi:hypothetical protein
MPYVKSPLSSRPIDSYLLRTRSDPSASICIVDSDTDDDVTLLPSSQQSTESVTSSMSPPSFPSPTSYPTRTPRPQRIECFFPRSSSLPLSINHTDNDDEENKLPLSVVTNVVDSPAIIKNRANNAKQRDFYQSVRDHFGHVDDVKMCRNCGERKHTTIHHEDEFRRNGNIRAPSEMRPRALKAEIVRCTRENGTIGLASLCNQCHYEAERRFRKSSRLSLMNRSRYERNIKADIAAKLARGKCQCDHDCGVLVTLQNLQEFEWDHLVQKPDDPSYRCVSRLVAAASLKRCEEERIKCRLLYSLCHKAHTQMQRRRRRVSIPT